MLICFFSLNIPFKKSCLCLYNSLSVSDFMTWLTVTEYRCPRICFVWVTRRVPHVKQQLFTSGFQWGSCCSIFNFLCSILYIIVLFLLIIVLSVLFDLRLFISLWYLQTFLTVVNLCFFSFLMLKVGVHSCIFVLLVVHHCLVMVNFNIEMERVDCSPYHVIVNNRSCDNE